MCRKTIRGAVKAPALRFGSAIKLSVSRAAGERGSARKEDWPARSGDAAKASELRGGTIDQEDAGRVADDTDVQSGISGAEGTFLCGGAGMLRFGSFALPAEGCDSWQPGSSAATD